MEKQSDAGVPADVDEWTPEDHAAVQRWFQNWKAKRAESHRLEVVEEVPNGPTMEKLVDALEHDFELAAILLDEAVKTEGSRRIDVVNAADRFVRAHLRFNAACDVMG